MIVKYCMCSGMNLINAHTCHYLTKFFNNLHKGKNCYQSEELKEWDLTKNIILASGNDLFFYEVTKSIVIYICYPTPWWDSSPPRPCWSPKLFVLVTICWYPWRPWRRNQWRVVVISHQLSMTTRRCQNLYVFSQFNILACLTLYPNMK